VGVDAPAPLCLDKEGVAALLQVSARTVRRLDDAGKLPAALRFGTSKRWLRTDIEAWLRAGAPPRKQWSAMRSRAS
jgi:excisionase family DNA binding protein